MVIQIIQLHNQLGNQLLMQSSYINAQSIIYTVTFAQISHLHMQDLIMHAQLQLRYNQIYLRIKLQILARIHNQLRTQLVMQYFI